MRSTLIIAVFAVSALAAPIAHPQDKTANKEVRGVARPNTKPGIFGDNGTPTRKRGVQVAQPLDRRGYFTSNGKRDLQVEARFSRTHDSKRDVDEDGEWELHANDRREAIFSRAKGSRDVGVDVKRDPTFTRGGERRDVEEDVQATSKEARGVARPNTTHDKRSAEPEPFTRGGERREIEEDTEGIEARGFNRGSHPSGHPGRRSAEAVNRINGRSAEPEPINRSDEWSRSADPEPAFTRGG